MRAARRNFIMGVTSILCAAFAILSALLVAERVGHAVFMFWKFYGYHDGPHTSLNFASGVLFTVGNLLFIGFVVLVRLKARFMGAARPEVLLTAAGILSFLAVCTYWALGLSPASFWR